MTACELCWEEASRRSLLHGGSPAEHYRAVLAENENDPTHRAGRVSMYGPGTPCPFHGKPIGPAPARNCEDCRAAIRKTIEGPDSGSDVEAGS